LGIIGGGQKSSEAVQDATAAQLFGVVCGEARPSLLSACVNR
jgi:hypothetical protein